MSMKEIPITKTGNRKVMLWIKEDLVEGLEEMKPEEITLQEFIRNILAHVVKKKPKIRMEG